MVKTRMILGALSRGFRSEPCRLVVGPPPDDEHPFAVWGQEWLALEIIPKAVKQGRPFWQIDNGFWDPGRGRSDGYYRMSYRSLSPIVLDYPSPERYAPVMRPWRKDGEHVLLAMPGIEYGLPLSVDMKSWCRTIEGRLRAATGRPIRIRPRKSEVPLSQDLKNAWAVVTHSSNVAVDAVIAGIPVFVEPTNPAAPVGRLDLDIENPAMPDRVHWLQSLACQHFKPAEMQGGIARKWMRRVTEQVDGKTD